MNSINTAEFATLEQVVTMAKQHRIAPNHILVPKIIIDVDHEKQVHILTLSTTIHVDQKLN